MAITQVIESAAANESPLAVLGSKPLVVLAPMAGITNQAYRTLCRGFGGGVFVSEMITSRGLVENHPTTWAMVEPEPDSSYRSIQLYGTDPLTVAAAVQLLIERGHADHVDLNMGCPVPKVTKRGGGAAIPWKRDLFADIVGAAVRAAARTSDKIGRDHVPVTVKMRTGIDDDHLTYLDAGEIAARLGVAWVALHARTAMQMYSGNADWRAIGRLVEHLDRFGTPVLGNGDVWAAKDAVRMITHTGCAGVVIGRGCLGRPWLFAHLDQVFQTGTSPAAHQARHPWAARGLEPSLGEVCDVMLHHLSLLIDLHGEIKACRDFRKHVAWYLKGFRIGSEIRHKFGLISTKQELVALTAGLNLKEPYPASVAERPRGRIRNSKSVHLPYGWLDSRSLNMQDHLTVKTAELEVSGG